MGKFTVIGYIEESGQSFADFVEAENGMHAFSKSAEDREGAVFVVALDGHQAEGEGVTFSGEGVVDAETVLKQDAVFG